MYCAESTAKCECNMIHLIYLDILQTSPSSTLVPALQYLKHHGAPGSNSRISLDTVLDPATLDAQRSIGVQSFVGPQRASISAAVAKWRRERQLREEGEICAGGDERVCKTGRADWERY